MFQVLVSPGTVGSDSFVLQLMSSDGNLLRVKEATLTLSLPERGIEPLPRKATLGADGYWLVPDVPIPHPGRWHVRVEALTDFQKIPCSRIRLRPRTTSSRGTRTYSVNH